MAEKNEKEATLEETTATTLTNEIFEREGVWGLPPPSSSY
jgi:hypothetical protein